MGLSLKSLGRIIDPVGAITRESSPIGSNGKVVAPSQRWSELRRTLKDKAPSWETVADVTARPFGTRTGLQRSLNKVQQAIDPIWTGRRIAENTAKAKRRTPLGKIDPIAKREAEDLDGMNKGQLTGKQVQHQTGAAAAIAATVYAASALGGASGGATGAAEGGTIGAEYGAGLTYDGSSMVGFLGEGGGGVGALEGAGYAAAGSNLAKAAATQAGAKTLSQGLAEQAGNYLLKVAASRGSQTTGSLDPMSYTPINPAPAGDDATGPGALPVAFGVGLLAAIAAVLAS